MSRAARSAVGSAVGSRIGPLEVGPVAHGGHCVARHDGRVIFVRHALPGETVRVEVTDDSHDRFWRADAVEVLSPSPDRVEPPCPIAGPGRCGGCDFQHVEPGAQRELKRAVVAEQLARLAGLEWSGEVEAVPGRSDGLGWRTRLRYQVDASGRAGLRAHRSHRIVPLPDGGCRIADPRTPAVTGRVWTPGAELVSAGAEHDQALLEDKSLVEGSPVLTERVGELALQVAAQGFWQVHPAAAEVLTSAVLEGLRPRAGEQALDLYCGVGLFAAVLARHGCRVVGVESVRPAVERARANLAPAGERARFLVGRVERTATRWPRTVDLVVLDPPRAGAGRAVVRAVAERSPRAVAYVACDPAALARDLAYAAEVGYRPVSIRAFDLFPMTHHVECVAVLTPG